MPACLPACPPACLAIDPHASWPPTVLQSDLPALHNIKAATEFATGSGCLQPTPLPTNPDITSGVLGICGDVTGAALKVSSVPQRSGAARGVIATELKRQQLPAAVVGVLGKDERRLRRPAAALAPDVHPPHNYTGKVVPAEVSDRGPCEAIPVGEPGVHEEPHFNLRGNAVPKAGGDWVTSTRQLGAQTLDTKTAKAAILGT